MSQLAGSYETPGGVKIQVALDPGGSLTLVLPGQPVIPLSHVKGTTFRTPRFSDVTLEFVVQDGQVKALKQKDPSGELTFPKK
jgi:hypothetical protein